MKLAGKNHLERSLPKIRLRVSGLAGVARREGYDEVIRQLIWLEIDVRKLRDELHMIENQEELCVDGTTSQNKDRM